VCDQATSNEEAKAHYGALENTTKRVVTPRKQTNKQTRIIQTLSMETKTEIIIRILNKTQILISLKDFSFNICSSPFAVSVRTLPALIYTPSSPSPVHSSQ
jgi:hypothetical protein